MTENNETDSTAVEGTDEGAEETTATEAETTEDNSKESGAEEEGTTDGEEDQEAEDEEPPTRKPRTNADWVALRRQRKLEKQKAGKGEQGEDEDDESYDDEDDDVDEEDAKIIEKVVSKRLAPFEKQQEIATLRGEINDFIAENPDFKPFAEKALKWAQHPSWKDVPTRQLMYAAAGDKLLKIGATRAKNAAIKTQKTKTGTGTGGNTGGTKPVMEMTDAEFEQEIQRVKTGQK